MAPVYEVERTALLVIDPYNDFLSEGGKLWPRIEGVARKVGLLENLRALTSEMRRRGYRQFIAPHRRWQPGDFESWNQPTPYQLGSAKKQVFAAGSWGGDWHPDFAPQPDDVVAKEHWGSSSFANTDLDVLLRQRGITHLVVVGLLANTCVEVTSRYAVELGYHVTLVKDATAGMDLKLEVVVVPVSDVDRAKQFYERLGFCEDVDYAASPTCSASRSTPWPPDPKRPGSGR